MSSQSRRDELFDRAMDLVRLAAKKAGLTQEEYLVEVLEGRRAQSRRAAVGSPAVAGER